MVQGGARPQRACPVPAKGLITESEAKKFIKKLNSIATSVAYEGTTSTLATWPLAKILPNTHFADTRKMDKKIQYVNRSF